jgi:GNAT superfamily N-acetyltransferase
MGAVIDLLQDVSVYRPAANTIPKLAGEFLNQENAYGCVAIHNGNLIGFGSIFILNRLRGGSSAIVEDVVVAASMRGQGVGKAVLNALTEFAAARDCFKVTLEASPRAERFYFASGFCPSGRVMKLML